MAGVPPPATPTDGEEEIFDAVDEFVSTASRAEDPLRLAPASVTVIHRQELDDFASTTLLDALTGTRGFFPSNDHTNPTLGLRGVQPFGSYGNRIQLQLDGHILNEDWIGQSTASFDFLSDLDAVERIEAVRGPGSVLFGTGAMLGVVGVVTPSSVPQRLARVGVSTIFPATGRVHVDTAGSLGDKSGAWVSAGGVAGAPYDLVMPSYAGTAWALDGRARNVGALDAGSILAKVWIDDVTFEIYGARQQHNLAAANYGTILGDQRTREDAERGFVELRYEPMLADHVQLLTRAYVDASAFAGVYPYTDPEYGVGRESFQSMWGGVEARVLLTMIDGLRVAAGAEAQTHPYPYTYGESSLPEPAAYIDEVHPYHRGSAYVNADWDPLASLRVSGGLRFDGWWFEELGTPDEPTGGRFIPSVNPRVALIWMPTDADTLKLMGGSAVRVPSIHELTYNDGNYTEARSPNLEPETIVTGELEYTRAISSTTRTIASLYASRLDGLSQQIGSGEEDDLLHYVNEKDPKYQTGAELAFEKTLSDDVFVQASSTWAVARRKDPLQGERLENAPDFMLAAKAAWHGLGPLAHLSTRVLLETPRLDREGNETTGAVVWDATLTGATHLGIDVDYAIGLRNLLDARVTHPVGGDIQELVLPQPGRALVAQVRFSL